MPPIMGAAAFLMADIMEVPYLDITKAALLPALLFYIAVFASVHLEAVKTGLEPLENIDIPDVMQSLKNSGHVLLSIPVFIGALISGYSVVFIVSWDHLPACTITAPSFKPIKSASIDSGGCFSC